MPRNLEQLLKHILRVFSSLGGGGVNSIFYKQCRYLPTSVLYCLLSKLYFLVISSVYSTDAVTSHDFSVNWCHKSRFLLYMQTFDM